MVPNVRSFYVEKTETPMLSMNVSTSPFLCFHSCRFGVSTARYAAFLTVGVIIAELATNSLTDALWEANNRGRTYAQVDWSKFDPADDDEEDEDDDE